MTKRKCRNCDDNVYQADPRMDLIHVATDDYICRQRLKGRLTAAE